MSPYAPLEWDDSFWGLLTVSRSAVQPFCGMSLSWGFSYVFVMIRKTPVEGRATRWLISAPRNWQVATFITCYISKIPAFRGTCHCWCWPQSPDWDSVVSPPGSGSSHTHTAPPIPVVPSLEESPPEEGGAMFCIIEGGDIHGLFRILTEDFSLFSIYLFIQPFLYISMNSWIFILYFRL